MVKRGELVNTRRLQDLVAVVTGASSGIGKAIALSFAAEGAKVVINFASKEDAAQEVVSQIRQQKGQAIAIKADVSNEKQVIKMFEKIKNEWDTVDILVNNAGIQRDAAFSSMALNDWQKVIDVNLTGAFLCSREAVREFLKRGLDTSRSLSAGKIIFISSVHESIPWAGHCNYAAAKGGIRLLMQTMAQELGSRKIRINSIAPGAVKTGINRDTWENPERAQRLLELIPWGRIAEPDDIGVIAAWLASDDADYIHGATIVADGGMMLYPAFISNG